MPRYMLTIAYDGTEFCGWQKQEPPERTPDGGANAALAHADPSLEAAPGRVALRTVQGVVEAAVRYVVREPVIVMGASRTDSGVHARGQVAAFTCSPLDPPENAPDGSSAAHSPAASADVPASHTGWPLSRGELTLLRAINGRLPRDVVVTACAHARPSFDPISDCTAKAYSYLLHVAPFAASDVRRGLRPVFDRGLVHHVHDDLDVGAMSRAAAHIVGEHDFSSFAAAGHGRLTTIRTVFACTVTDVTASSDPRLTMGARRVRIDVAGSGFLYNMVRIIAGTLVEVGRGRMNADDIPAIIAACDRTRAGPTLPPTGLCLEWVRYDGADGGPPAGG